MSQLNNQKPVKAIYREYGTLDVHSIFPTMQGEGPYAGRRAIFVRLWGCNLQCPGCDTEYTATKTQFSVDQLCDRLVVIADNEGYDLPNKQGLIVLTGGEPFRQHVSPFVNAMVRAGFDVQIETNGVSCHYSGNDICSLLPLVEMNRYGRMSSIKVVVSPKTSRICSAIEMRADCYKYVIKAGEVQPDGLPFHALEHRAKTPVARPGPGFYGRVYVQPMDEQNVELNKANLDATMTSVLEHGHTLCIQLHKLVGVE